MFLNFPTPSQHAFSRPESDRVVENNMPKHHTNLIHTSIQTVINSLSQSSLQE